MKIEHTGTTKVTVTVGSLRELIEAETGCGLPPMDELDFRLLTDGGASNILMADDTITVTWTSEAS